MLLGQYSPVAWSTGVFGKAGPDQPTSQRVGAELQFLADSLEFWEATFAVLHLSI